MKRIVPNIKLRWALPAGALALAGAAIVLVVVLSRPGALLGQSPIAQQLSNAAAQRPVNRTDRLIWDTQEVLRENPNSVDAYAVLGAAYVQKARDTGDPSFYAKAQSVLDEALNRDPQNV
jgi:cytochrome c-type biogenesis protein CcmH/NrfG